MTRESPGEIHHNTQALQGTKRVTMPTLLVAGWTRDLCSFPLFDYGTIFVHLVKTSAVLHIQTLPGSHTEDFTCDGYREILSGWGIKKEQLHLIVCDNAVNMIKAM